VNYVLEHGTTVSALCRFPDRDEAALRGGFRRL